ncbi:c-type cytochrome [Bizionia sp. KMM 8389]
MKITTTLIVGLFTVALMSCGGKEPEKKEVFTYGAKSTSAENNSGKTQTVPASKKVDLKNKGVGPITSISLDDTINQAMADEGADMFKRMCTACHRTDKKFIGPAPTGILKRRTPEWVMNMILNPEKMVKEDPLAKELLMEFNGAPMANQNLTEAEARAVLEYFRTL